jgi:hypothetical protein
MYLLAGSTTLGGQTHAHVEAPVRREHLPEEENEPQLHRLLEHLGEKPLPMPPARVVARAKALLGCRHAPEAQAVSFLEQAAVGLARLIFDSRAAPALAGFRGGGPQTHLVYASDAGEIDLQIRPERGSDKVHLLGQIESQRMARIAQLHQTETRRLDESPVDDRGMFSFEVPPGHYDLVIVLDGGSVRVPALEL